MSMNKDNVYVAKLGKTVGLKGHVKLFIDSDFPEQFKKGSSFLTNRNLNLVIKDYSATREIVQFENYDDVDLAKKLTNQELFSTPEQTRNNCQLAENEFFWFDLIDCDVYEDDLKLGKVVDVHRYPTSDYLEITTDSTLVEKELPKTFLLPHIFNQYVLEVNVDEKKITVKDAYDILENS